MKWITTNWIKEHSRICGDAEDSLLELYGESAEEMVANYLGRGTLDECDASLRMEYGDVPKNIMHAALMLVDVSYTYRSPIAPTNMYIIPYTFEILIKPYMKLTSGC